MKWMADLVFFAREGWMNFTRSRLLSVFSIIIIAISLAIITVFVFIMRLVFILGFILGFVFFIR